jgi:hypothetical protein
MIRLGDVVGERVCRNCKWVWYYGAGIWLCSRVGKKLSEGVLEVNPLQKGCDWWEKGEEFVKGVEKKV